MRPTRRGFSPTDALPDDVRGILERRLIELAGLSLLVIAGGGAVALATWNVQDPSLNHATSGPVQNLLGPIGAAFSDVMMQLFGVGAIAVLMPVAIWGWRLLAHKSFETEKRRLMSWLAGAALAAGFASGFPPSPHWPLPSGLGGVVGDWAFGVPAILLFARSPGLGQTILTLLLGAGALFLLFVASGFLLRPLRQERPAPHMPIRLRGEPRLPPADEEDEEERDRSVPLGALMHWLLSLKHALSRQRLRGQRGYARDGARRIGITDVLARLRPGSEDDMPEMRPRREPAISARTAPRPDARRPHEAVALDEIPTGPEYDDDEEEEDVPPVSPQRRRQGASEMADAAERSAGPLRVSAPAAAVKQGKRLGRSSDVGTSYEQTWEFPPLGLLAEPRKAVGAAVAPELLESNARVLEGVLEDFGVRGEIIHVRPGPVVTLYELEPAPGIKSSRVIGLSDDIARSMSALSARVAVVPGRNVIGIELPNAKRETVYFRELIGSQAFETSKFKLALCLGKTIGGEPVIAELAKMPHLLVAGTTGSGKSVAINTMILSLLYRLKPEQCRLIMVDPKMLELSVYDGIPHLLAPVVTDPKKAVLALKWAVREMEERYKKMSKLGVRNIDGYNERAAEAKTSGETVLRTVQTGFDRDTGEALYEQEAMDLAPMPYIVVIVDEMADLMMVAGKDIEGAIQRLAQMARAAGIHLIMATQRPSVDVITGTIKANFPTRISFQVTSKIDSRTILGEQGAEQLLGQGDMLHMAGGGRIARVHGPFVSDEEVEKVVAHLKSQGRPDYLDAITADEEEEGEDEAGEDGAVFDKGAFGEESGSDLYEQAVKVVMRDKKCSTSYIQRRLQIGYNRAASLVERMEKEGLVGPANHAGKREIIAQSRDRIIHDLHSHEDEEEEEY
jgi:S-DNA-T family DNA segregation ATPase FtsK/SpoIIIE